MWRRRRAVAVFLVAPIAATVAAAAARQYPFSDRLILFLLPSLLLGLAEAIEWARQFLGRRHTVLGALTAAILVALALSPMALRPPPYQLDDVKSALAHVAARRQPEDRMYVYYGAAPAVAYYAPRYGLEPRAYDVGGCHRGDGRRYFEELDTFRGQPRVWVVIAHSPSTLGEGTDIAGYLDAIGHRREAFVAPSRTMGVAPPVEVFLYDLSDGERLTRAAAAAFPVTGPTGGVEGWECGHGPVAMVAPTIR